MPLGKDMHLTIGRTIPNPHARYSTIRADVGMTVTLFGDDNIPEVRATMLRDLQAQLDATLASEIIRIQEKE